MGTLTFIDAAYPGSYPAADGFCFYIGGDTPHVWTAVEVAGLKGRYRYLLPIYVRSNPPGPGAAGDVAAAVAHLKIIGAPPGTLVAWDSEIAVDAPYVQAVYADLRTAGYVLIEYASQSAVFAEQNPDGYYWGADWTNARHLHSGDVITQYVSFSGYDESLASSALPFWDTRGPAPVPPVPAPTFPYPAGDYLGLESADQHCHSGFYPADQVNVSIWQAQMARRGWTLAADGIFGVASDQACRQFQQEKGVRVDGLVGPVTWGLAWTAPVT